MIDATLSRRQVLASLAGAVAGLGYSSNLAPLFAGAKKKRLFKIGACDWSIGKTLSVASMEAAKKLGLDGVQVSFDRPGKGADLRKEEVRKQYKEVARKHGVRIASLAMGVLNHVPYATSPEAERWVEECIAVLPKLGVKVVLLAFFGRGDLKGKPELVKKVIQRLKKVAPKAEKAGVVLGIETYLNVDEHIRILDAVGSPAVQVYYDVANMNVKGYDIYKEIRKLGRKRICEFHCKENGFLLGRGRVDFRKVKEAIDDIGYQGWLIIEGATEGKKSLVDCYVHNQKYLRSIFPTQKKKKQ